MKKILFIADSILRTSGYGIVARNIISRLVDTKKYDIGLLGLADIHVPLDLPIKYYTQIKNHKNCCNRDMIIEYTEGNSERQYLTNNLFEPLHANQNKCIRGVNDLADNYAYDSVYHVIQHFKPDIVIPINDIWGLYNINYIRNRSCFKFVPYLAIDSEFMFHELKIPNHRPGLPNLNTVDVIKKCDKVIVFTDWATEVLNKTARLLTGSNFSNLDVISHGVDTNVWKPLNIPKHELKQKHFNLPPNSFLISCISRNQPRKMFDLSIRTLKEFIDKYEKGNRKAYLYFHCAVEDQSGWPLEWLAHNYGVHDRCIFDKNLRPGLGVPVEILNEKFQASDVHMLLSSSEGYALTLLETLAAGIPTLTTNYSAQGDWGKDVLMYCKTAEYIHEPNTGFKKAIASTKDAAKQLSLLYNSQILCNDYIKKGLKLAKKLDWNNISKIWEDKLDAIDISDLKENRYNDPNIYPLTNDPNDMTLVMMPK